MFVERANLLSLMNTPASTSEYMVLFRSTAWERGLSPDELQKTITETMSWFDQLFQQGKVRGAQPLHEEGKIISGKHGRVVADGPFAESKETVGGYVLLLVDTMDEAVEIARTWPLLEHGATVEVRPVAAQCPSFHRIQSAKAKELAEACA
jgi:hypothetical protein